MEMGEIVMPHRISTKWVAPIITVLLTLGLVSGLHALTTHSSAKARTTAAAPAATTPAQIVLASDSWNLTFTELSSMTSTITPGATSTGHTKLPGVAQPPTVVLTRNLDPAGNQTLSAWHQAALQGEPTALMDVTLTLTETGGPVTYHLIDAWLSKLEVSGLTAGSKQPAVETVKIVCDSIIVQ